MSLGIFGKKQSIEEHKEILPIDTIAAKVNTKSNELIIQPFTNKEYDATTHKQKITLRSSIGVLQEVTAPLGEELVIRLSDQLRRTLHAATNNSLTIDFYVSKNGTDDLIYQIITDMNNYGTKPANPNKVFKEPPKKEKKNTSWYTILQSGNYLGHPKSIITRDKEGTIKGGVQKRIYEYVQLAKKIRFSSPFAKAPPITQTYFSTYLDEEQERVDYRDMDREDVHEITQKENAFLADLKRINSDYQKNILHLSHKAYINSFPNKHHQAMNSLEKMVDDQQYNALFAEELIMLATRTHHTNIHRWNSSLVDNKAVQEKVYELYQQRKEGKHAQTVKEMTHKLATDYAKETKGMIMSTSTFYKYLKKAKNDEIPTAQA